MTVTDAVVCWVPASIGVLSPVKAAFSAIGSGVTPLTIDAEGRATVTLAPLCITKAGSALFFMEQSDDCGASDRRCRGGHASRAARTGPCGGAMSAT